MCFGNKVQIQIIRFISYTNSLTNKLIGACEIHVFSFFPVILPPSERAMFLRTACTFLHRGGGKCHRLPAFPQHHLQVSAWDTSCLGFFFVIWSRSLLSWQSLLIFRDLKPENILLDAQVRNLFIFDWNVLHISGKYLFKVCLHLYLYHFLYLYCLLIQF